MANEGCYAFKFYLACLVAGGYKEKIVFHLRRIKPQAVLSFDPTGGYGHPDHMAISQFSTAAMVCSRDHKYKPGGQNQTI